VPVVQLIGHNLTYPLCDVLRLFYGPDIHVLGSRIQAGPEDVLINSELDLTLPEKLQRREIKRQLYRQLSELTGYQFPWGSLTGIRPTQVAAEALRACPSIGEARDMLISHYFVSPEKADLALQTARAEEYLLIRIPPCSAMVYLGVPFCPTRCAYCSFITQDAVHKASLLGPYVDAVLTETTAFFGQLGQTLPISAVYVGGGTPTSLPNDLFARFLQGTLSQLPLLPGAEITVEAGRPDTITAEKLQVVQQCKATRLCINPQTFHDATLERIGRRHTTRQTVEAFKLARSMGFQSINMDLIAGLPGETPGDFADSLEQALALAPDSITVHTLALKRSSRLQQERLTAGNHHGLPDPALAAMLIKARQKLADAGLLPYYLYRQKDVAGSLENTGFARPGEGSIYNVGMMSDRCSIIGLGSGAMSKKVTGTRVERLGNPRDISDYINRTAELAEKKIALFKTGEG
jgi:coproporphyrinogen dehydrogenase HemZ